MTAQLFYAISLIGVSLYLLILGYRWDFRIETAKDMIVASAILGAPGVLAFGGWWGLQKQKLWGWVIALCADTLLVFIFTYSVADDGVRNTDWDMAAYTILSWIVAACLLIPSVRRYYVRGHEIRAAQISP